MNCAAKSADDLEPKGNMTMKKHALWIFTLAVVLLFTACAHQRAAEDQCPEDTVKAFLTSFYTANEDDRYTQFLSDTESVVSDAALTEANERYHAALAALSTEALVDMLAANRTLSRYDEANAGQSVAVQSVELQTDDGFFTFTVQVDADGTAQTYTGQISVSAETGLVDNFYQAGA